MICRTANRRFDPRSASIAGLAFALMTGGALAQVDKAGDRLDALKERDQQLQSLRDEQKKTAETEASLKREIEQIGADRRKLNQDLIDTATRIRAVEERIAGAEARLKPLDENEQSIRRSLESRRAVIADVLAALQRMGRRPPPALLVSPEDALTAVRIAILLGAVVPDMRSQAEALANDLQQLVTVRNGIEAERARMKTAIASIDAERTRLAALTEERQKQQGEREASLNAERAKAQDLAKQADNVKDLITKLEQGLDSATKAAREAARSDSRPAMAALRDPGRLAPAVAFASLRGQIPVPVNGVKIRDFGASDGIGGVEKGISLATRAGAQVTAPTDGWVVYAGPFRSYGQLLILNAGGGYHILLAGMERISVDLGQFVLTGEPVAVMGSASHIAAILATGSSQPVLYVEFRKDGIPVDPGPWWASQVEKVRG
ncbi:MAG: peptidoglycan DD-metalloendopeptidase family protein [Pseudolabrys sp.]|nr:peptidoglycan DD-metalloendopeptidase family protein [Pseudolabrys sp.]